MGETTPMLLIFPVSLGNSHLGDEGKKLKLVSLGGRLKKAGM